MSVQTETSFENFLNQHTDEAWEQIVKTLLPSIHEVDKTATQIWFAFYPLSLLQALAQADDPELLAAQLLLKGEYYLKDQIDSSHHFLYGHRYWPEVKQAIIKGDAKSASIAAASILAKVSRDALMRTLDWRHPGYGFADHKGYPVRAHYNALARLGACPAHRRSFGPVREVLGLPPLPPWPLASERASATSGPEA